jgi:hypothetical protein
LFYIMMIVSKERNMNYNIVIEYTDNAERAGKLTLTDDKGQVVLSKVPVAIPSAILNYPSVEHDNLQFKRLKANPDFEVVDKSSIYKNTIKKLEKE